MEDHHLVNELLSRVAPGKRFVEVADVRLGGFANRGRRTEVAGHVALPSLMGATSATIGLYGTTNTSSCSGLDMTFPLGRFKTQPRGFHAGEVSHISMMTDRARSR